MRRSKRRSDFNPFVSLTDILFNLVLLLIFVSALFSQDINKKFAENQDFQRRLSAMQLERDDLIDNVDSLTGELDTAADLEAALRENNTTLEEQIGILVSNLDSAQIRQQELAQQISVILGDLGSAEENNQILNEKITVILGDLDIAQDVQKILEDQITLVLGDAENLRSQVAQLSRNNFLVLELEWLTESHDLDLHVIDPRGNRFYWNQASYPDESSRLTLDNRIGARPNKPGLEIFTARDVELGTYKIELGLWGCNRGSGNGTYQACTDDGAANVLIRHRDGDDLVASIPIPRDQSYASLDGSNFSLNEGLFDRLILVAEVEVVEENGEVQVRVKPADGLSSTRLALQESP